jgi:hypothetical protein
VAADKNEYEEFREALIASVNKMKIKIGKLIDLTVLNQNFVSPQEKSAKQMNIIR